MALNHGGQLNKIAALYKRPVEDWLELSTGISPFIYPVPEVPINYWQNLPQIPAELIQAAKAYYQTDHCFVCNGSQSIIEVLPSLWQNLTMGQFEAGCNKVYLPKVGYKEHQQAWLTAGYMPEYFQDELPKELERDSVIVVINPNNPTGDIYSKKSLLALQKKAIKSNSLLVIDEAFIDVLPAEYSMTDSISNTHTFVFKSFGKFFGLAGLRIGFICTSGNLHNELKAHIPLWQTNGPAMYIAMQALADREWQQTQLNRLTEQSELMADFLQQNLQPENLTKTPLFITVYLDNAIMLHHKLCEQGIYARLTDEQDAIRFGIIHPNDFVKFKTRLNAAIN